MELNNPFARMAAVPSFDVTSATLPESLELPPAQYSGMFGIPGGADRSPELSWQGAPTATKSYCVTMVDPDAPTGSGIWHWAIANLPASVTHLPEGAGDPGSVLPEGAICLPNDSRLRQYVGAAPPPGHGQHRYFFVVHAVDVPRLEIDPDGTPAVLGMMLFEHTLARAVLVATGELR